VHELPEHRRRERRRRPRRTMQLGRQIGGVPALREDVSGKQDIVQTIRFEKGLENVLFLVYQ